MKTEERFSVKRLFIVLGIVLVFLLLFFGKVIKTQVFMRPVWAGLPPITAIGPITGTPQVGTELTVGALTPGQCTATYQWRIADTSDGTYADIGGATDSTYTPVADDATKYIKVVATATDGCSGTVTSAAVGLVTIPLSAIGPITGTPQVGAELTVGALTPSDATATYQWRIADTSDGTYADIGGATDSTYTPVADDATKYIKVVATGTDNYSSTVTSAATTAVANASQSAPTGLVGVAPTTYNGSDGSITGVTDAMEYRISTDESYTSVTASATTITSLSPGTYEVRYAAYTGYNASPDDEVVVADGPNADQSAPTGLTGVAPTTYGGSDGSITGVDTTMEYELEGAGSYTAVTGTTIDGLSAGTYEVRYAAYTGYNASPDDEVVVADGPSGTPTPTPTPSDSPSSPSAPTCGQSAPTGVPNLYKITTTGTTASLYFTSVDNATNYQVFYGYSSGDSRFGGTFSGSSPVTINYLKPFTLYYFAVKGENVCAGGPLSGWLYAVTNGSGSYAGGTNTTNTTAQNNSTYQSPSASPTPTPSPLASPPPSQPSVQNNSSSVSFFSGILHFILHLFGR